MTLSVAPVALCATQIKFATNSENSPGFNAGSSVRYDIKSRSGTTEMVARKEPFFRPSRDSHSYNNIYPALKHWAIIANPGVRAPRFKCGVDSQTTFRRLDFHALR